MKFTYKKSLIEAALLVVLVIPFGLLRQFLPHGISWNGRWPTSTTSAQEAYQMMARPGDPGFISLSEMIEIQEKGNVVILDARSAEEYAAGRIPGARNLPYYEMEAKRKEALEGVSVIDPIVIYCEGVGCELSFFLGRDLQAENFSNIRIFYGGYPEWKEAGLKIEK